MYNQQSLISSSPVVKRLRSSGWVIEVQKDVSEILIENGVELDSINAIIWSHKHFDHIGDPTKFPSSTKLVVGPGFKKGFLPGAPEDPEGLHSSAWESRELVELEFNTGLKIGRLDAIDYFGDGSLYLLDTSGHCIDHICALVKTTKDSWMLLGGDFAHHGSEYRPSQHYPLPDAISLSPYDGKESSGQFPPSSSCPGHIFLEEAHPTKNPKESFKQPAEMKSADHQETSRSIAKLQELDAREDVFTVIAHDAGLLGILDFFPRMANEWTEKGWREEGYWRFLGDFRTSAGSKSETKL